MAWNLNIPHATTEHFDATVDAAVRAARGELTGAGALPDAEAGVAALKALVRNLPKHDDTWLIGANLAGHANPTGLPPDGSGWPEDSLTIRIWRAGAVEPKAKAKAEPVAPPRPPAVVPPTPPVKPKE